MFLSIQLSYSIDFGVLRLYMIRAATKLWIPVRKEYRKGPIFRIAGITLRGNFQMKSIRMLSTQHSMTSLHTQIGLAGHGSFVRGKSQ